MIMVMTVCSQFQRKSEKEIKEAYPFLGNLITVIKNMIDKLKT